MLVDFTRDELQLGHVVMHIETDGFAVDDPEVHHDVPVHARTNARAHTNTHTRPQYSITSPSTGNGKYKGTNSLVSLQSTDL